ncbi:MAG: HAMP domain-containing histidine kinase [Candidatus Margulisbacteria bacterium]|nr:HAMP domain-containing histidine kinase [Candidatus Margulisiibacteriota bacterium]
MDPELRPKEAPFQIQALKKRVEMGGKLLSETIVRLRDIQTNLEKTKEEYERKKFEATADKMFNGIVVCASDWTVTNANPSALKYLETSDTKSFNLPDYLFDKFTVSITKEMLIDLSLPYKTFNLIREETEQFNALFLEVGMDVLKDHLGVVSDIIITFEDATERRKEERVKQDFLSLLSHKLMTPLTSIIGRSELLLKGIYGPMNDEQKKVVMVIDNQAEKQKSLVDKLLKFTSIIYDHPSAPKEAINLAETLPAIANSAVKSSGNGKKIEIEVICKNRELNLRINKNQFETIFSNLIENSIKFGDKDPVKISLSAEETTSGVNLIVADNGPGIPPEEQERIFSGLYQVEKYFTGQIEGAGLGLALVKKIVESNSGTIAVKSSISRGTELRINLPGS